MNEELYRYVINSLKLGYTPEGITNALLSQGWSPDDIDAIFQYIERELEVAEPQGVQHKLLQDRAFVFALIGTVIVLGVASFVYGMYVIFSGPDESVSVPEDVTQDEQVAVVEGEVSELGVEEELSDENDTSDELVESSIQEPQNHSFDFTPPEKLLEEQTPSLRILNKALIAEMESFKIPEDSPYYSNRKGYLESAIAFAKCEPVNLDRDREIIGFSDGTCNYVRTETMVSDKIECGFSISQIKQIAAEFFEIAKSDVTMVSVFKAGANFQLGDGDEPYNPDSWYYGFSYEDSNRDDDYLISTFRNLQDDPTVCTKNS